MVPQINRRLSKKNELWEILMPEPFVIDPNLKDEDLITYMIEIDNENDMHNFITDALQQPTKIIVVSCSEQDIYDYFNSDYDTFKYVAVKKENRIIITVTDKTGNYIGRGEVIKLGKKIMLDGMSEVLGEHMDDFAARYYKGAKRMDGIMFKLKMVKKQLATGTSQLS